MAFRNLWRRKSRTILTILSVVIGTISIIMMLSLGIGMKDQQEEMINAFGGLDTIEIISDPTSPQKINQATANKFKNIKGVRVVVPHKDFFGQIMVKGHEDMTLSTYQGVRVVPDEVFDKLRREDFDQGRRLSPTDKNAMLVTNQAKVLQEVKNPDQDWFNQEPVKDFDLLGANYILRLGYKDEDEGPNFGEDMEAYLGENTNKESYVDIPLEIKGQLSKEAFLSGFFAYINETTYKNIEKEDQKLEFSQVNESLDPMGNPSPNKKNSSYLYNGISVVCDDYETVKYVDQEIKDMGYQTQSNTEMIDEINSATSKLMMILGGIGSIAFIVSAIGIINTMLMSIYERQKEIGVMKVIGASISDIRSMFLLESGFIGFFGGILGLILSIGLSSLLNNLFMSTLDPDMVGEEFTKLFSIPPWLALAGVVFSALVGVLAGYLPAKRATRLSAIETLRSN